MISKISGSSNSSAERFGSGYAASSSDASSSFGDSFDTITIGYEQSAQSRRSGFAAGLSAPLIDEINALLDAKRGSRAVAAIMNESSQQACAEGVRFKPSQIDSIFYQGLGRRHVLTKEMEMPQAIAEKLATLHAKGIESRGMTRRINPIATREHLFIPRSVIEFYCRTHFAKKLDRPPIPKIAANIFAVIDGEDANRLPPLRMPQDDATRKWLRMITVRRAIRASKSPTASRASSKARSSAN